MRCRDAANQLQQYIDHRLTVEQVRALEAHIVQCTSCSYELSLLESVAASLREIAPVTEPEDLTLRIMRKVAVTPQHKKERTYIVLRPSLPELIAVVLLATISTLGVMWQQPGLRTMLPIANGHNSLSVAFLGLLHSLTTGNTGLLLLALWVVGALLGVFITLALAGGELRSQLFKAMLERLPER